MFWLEILQKLISCAACLLERLEYYINGSDHFFLMIKYTFVIRTELAYYKITYLGTRSEMEYNLTH